jgi:hypothetical protein
MDTLKLCDVSVLVNYLATDVDVHSLWPLSIDCSSSSKDYGGV